MSTEHEAMIDIQKKVARATLAMGRITKSKTADLGNYKYTYATLTDTLQTVKEALVEEGLALMQPIVVDDNGHMIVTTTVVDKSTGESINYGGPGINLKADPQAMGSAISYYRRYALTSLFGLEVDDDDGGQGNRAATRPQERSPAEAEVRKIVAGMQDDERAEFQQAFKERFSSTLTQLPESSHGEALGFAKEWLADRQPFTDEETSS